MTWKDKLKKYEGPESERYRTLGSAYNPDPDEEDRYEEMVEDICIRCGKKLKENEGFTDTRLGRQYDNICDACKRKNPNDP
tara:strand:- start:185 stop:427 length:243 start_codon:yes stop_codon:yes gene_type:complete